MESIAEVFFLNVIVISLISIIRNSNFSTRNSSPLAIRNTTRKANLIRDIFYDRCVRGE